MITINGEPFDLDLKVEEEILHLRDLKSEQAEQIKYEHDKWYSAEKDVDDKDAENKRLKELLEAKDELLVCYRLGRRPTEKLMKKLDRLKAAPPQEKDNDT